MANAATMEGPRYARSAFIRPIILCLAGLIAVSIGINLIGQWFGHSISMAGHTDSTRTYEVVIGNNVIVAPANAIRFDHARRDGISQRLDLYMRWPDLGGYTDATRDDFNNVGSERRIIFASFEPRLMSRDMSGRFGPIYSGLIETQGSDGPAGLRVYAFSPKSGYVNEQLMVGEREGETPFVARCQIGEAAKQSLAPCQRDIDTGDNLSLSYRFPAALLQDWRKLDAAISVKAGSLIRTGRVSG